MISRLFLYFYIVTVVFFADTYLVLPWIRVVSILNYALLILLLLKRGRHVFAGFNKTQKTFFVFIFYVFIINLIRNSFQDSLSYFLGAVTFPFIWKAFGENEDNARLVRFFIVFYLVFTSIFSLLQLGGVPVTIGSLLAGTGFIGTDIDYSGVTSQGLRITGADMNSIAYACILGMIIIYYYFRFEAERRFKYLLITMFTAILLLSTQSRAALFSIIPVIILTKIITQSSLKDRIRLFVGVSLLLIISAIAFLPVLKAEFPRLFLSISEDGSLIHRIQANVYGSVGTLFKSPLLGVPFDDGLEAMKVGYHKLGLFVGSRFIPIVTHHNQPLFFLRYYGLIGIILLLIFYFRVIRFSLSEHNTLFIKQYLFGIILFHFLYTLTHNNKISMDYYLFILLALNSSNFNQQGYEE